MRPTQWQRTRCAFMHPLPAKGETSMDPLRLSGWQFFFFYALCLAGAVGIAHFLARWLRRPADEPVELPELSTYEIAYLTGGEQQVVAVALAQLICSEAISVDAKERRCLATSQLPATAHPVE